MVARTRNIKPGFFLNDQLATIEPLGRLLFAGLWTLADREGRLDDRPKRIKAEILPYDDCDVDSLLAALEGAGFIVRYTIAEQNYIQIINFKKHQNPHPREVASIIPARPCPGNTQDMPSNIQDNALQQSGNAIPSIPSGSSIPSENIYSLSAHKVFTAWNSQGIIAHQELTPDIAKAIEAAVQTHGIEKILLSIERYAQIYKDANYFFSYKWSLLKFLKQKNALPDFLNGGCKWEDYVSRSRDGPGGAQTNKTGEEGENIDWGFQKT
jgi:hypothetical protein